MYDFRKGHMQYQFRLIAYMLLVSLLGDYKLPNNKNDEEISFCP